MVLLQELFHDAAKQYPENYAVIWDTDSGEISTTYAEMYAESCRISETLIAAGAEREFVGVIVENFMVYPTLLIGILHADCAFVPIELDTKLDSSQLIQNINIRFIFSDKINILKKGWKLEKHIRIHHQNVFLLSAEKPHKNFENGRFTMAYAMQSSGSTGKPKVIRASHQSIVPNIINLRNTFNATSKDTVFLSYPITFDPSIVEIFVTLSSGASLLIAPYHIKAAPGPVLFEYLFGKSRKCCGKVSVLSMTPSYASCLLGSSSGEVSVIVDPPVRLLSLGGEPCPSSKTLKEWQKKLGGKAQVFSLYGITEVSCWASVVEVQFNEEGNRDEEDNEDWDSQSSDSKVMKFETHDPPLGFPLIETILEVRDCKGNVVKNGTGELFIGSKTRVCLLDDEDPSILENGEAIYRATGDIVNICDTLKGTKPLISFIQRKDDSIKRFGKWILTKNIENLAAEFVWTYQDMRQILVDASCCVSCGKNSERKKIALFVVPSDKELLVSQALKQAFVEDLMSHLYKLLPSNSWPDVILPIEELPLTEHAKVNKWKLKRISEEFLSSKSNEIMQRSDSHLDYFHHLWMKYLNLRIPPSPTDRFLSSGGDSLKALQLMSELETNYLISPKLLTILLKGTYVEACACITCHSFKSVSNNLGNTSTLASGKRVQAEEVVSPEKRSKFSESTSRTENDNEFILPQFEYRRGTVIKRSSVAEIKPTVIAKENSVSLKIKWKYNLGKCIDASPVLLETGSKRLVVVGSHSHLLVIIDACTSERISSCELPDRIESSACFSICGEFVFVGCYDYSLYSIKVSNGSVEWSFQTGNMIKSSPVLANSGSMVIFGSYDGFLYCLQTKIGELVWKVKPGEGAIYSSPCLVPKNLMHDNATNVSKNLISSGVILIGTLGGKCAAISELSGMVLWNHDIQSPVFTSPSYYKDRALFSSVTGKVICLLIDSGEEVWSFKAKGNIFSSPSILKTEEILIVFGCHDSSLYCLNDNGEVKWQTELDSAIFSIPFLHPVQINNSSRNEIHNNYWISVTSTKGFIYLIEKDKGDIKASMNIKNEIFSSPLVFQNTIIFGCRDNFLYSIKIS